MTQESILGASKLVAFIPTTDRPKARTFYQNVLGLPVLFDDPHFATDFDANGTKLRLTSVQQHQPAPFTVLGWQVESIEAVVRKLQTAGVEFLRYPGLNDANPLAIWTAPSGARVAWFHDPDKNVLSIMEPA